MTTLTWNIGLNSGKGIQEWAKACRCWFQMASQVESTYENQIYIQSHHVQKMPKVQGCNYPLLLITKNCITT
jgi:hypothetical protein